MKITLFCFFLLFCNIVNSNNLVKDTLFLDDGSFIIGNIIDFTAVQTDSEPIGKITLYYLVTFNVNSVDSAVLISKFSTEEINYILLKGKNTVKLSQEYRNKIPLKIHKIKLVNNQNFYEKEKNNKINKAGNQLILAGTAFLIASALPILISFNLPLELLYGSIASGSIGLFSLITAGVNLKKYTQIKMKKLTTITFNDDGSMNWVYN